MHACGWVGGWVGRALGGVGVCVCVGGEGGGQMPTPYIAKTHNRVLQENMMASSFGWMHRSSKSHFLYQCRWSKIW